MLTILSVAIGVILVLLLMSILASTMHDILSSMFSLRGKHLRKTLVNMLGQQSGAFFKHPFFRQLTYADHQNNSNSDYALPDWINKDTFSSILHDLLQHGQGNDLAEKIRNQEDTGLRRMLEFLSRESNGTVGGLKERIGNWFDEVMNRSSTYFSRATKWRLFFIGVALAALLNADTIQIYKTLSVNAELQEQMAAIAQKITAADTLPVVKRDTVLRKQLANSAAFLNEQLAGTASTLGLGWNAPDQKENLPYWPVKILGFLLTGIAVTFGAPFWFDLLKKILSLRNNLSGSNSNKTTTEPSTNVPAADNQPIEKIKEDKKLATTINDSIKANQESNDADNRSNPDEEEEAVG